MQRAMSTFEEKRNGGQASGKAKFHSDGDKGSVQGLLIKNESRIGRWGAQECEPVRGDVELARAGKYADGGGFVHDRTGNASAWPVRSTAVVLPRGDCASKWRHGRELVGRNAIQPGTI